MADPKIKYDIEANASGKAGVDALAKSLDSLDSAIDPTLAQRGKELADELRRLGDQQAAIDRFRELKQRTQETAEALRVSQTSAQAFGRELAAAGTPTKAQAGQMERLRDAVRAAKTEELASVQALQSQRQALAAAGIDTEKLVVHQTALAQRTAQLVQSGQRVGEAYQAQAVAAEASAARQVRSHQRISDGVRSISEQLGEVQRLAAAAIGGQLLGGVAGDVAKTADEYSNLASRIRLATGEGTAFDQAFQGVFDVATRTNSSLESTGTLFTRLVQAGKEVNLSNQAALGLTETINQAIQVSGGSAQASDAAIQQLIQGLQGGVLRGEEFNSVMEQAPRLAKALADGLGITTGELRKQAEAGKLTSQVVIGALQGQADVVAREFDKLPPTVGRALQNLSTEWTRYVGQVDQANGISATAARGINALASNLGTLGNVLIEAGKAAIAFKAFDLAATLAAKASAARQAAAAVAADTAATAASTAALATNTAALAANNQAKATSATASTAAATAQAGLMTRLIAGASTAGAVGAAVTAAAAAASVLYDGIKAGGTALGEWVARMAGARDRSGELAAAMKAEGEVAAENARQKAALAQQQQIAAEKALGLSKVAAQLVSDFEGMRAKNESVQASLEKLTKALQLGDLQGIRDAGSALDALAVKGQVTSQQVRDALATALNGRDLGIFEAQARAAFDGSEQGARRLQAAIDAIAQESLRRAGSSLQELRTGFSATSASAINDVDQLSASLSALGAKGPEVGRMLSGSLDRALDAANSERAIQGVIDRWRSLGQQGQITGEQLAAGLEKARAKLDELRPGISSTEEALKNFGLRTQAQLQQTADLMSKSWAQILNDTTVSLANKVRAFEQYKEAATAANNGIVPSQLRVQEEMLRIQVSARATGDAIGRSMDAAGQRVMALGAQVAQTAGIIDTARSKVGGDYANNPNAAGNVQAFGAPVTTGFEELQRKQALGTLSTSDKEAAASALATLKSWADVEKAGNGAVSTKTANSIETLNSMLRQIGELEAGAAKTVKTTGTSSATTTSTSSESTVGSSSHTVTINLAGQSKTINLSSASDSTALVDLLKQLQTAAGVAS